MSYMKQGSPFLYDDDTGDIIGVKDRDGGETIFLNLNTANGNTVLVGADYSLPLTGIDRHPLLAQESKGITLVDFQSLTGFVIPSGVTAEIVPANQPSIKTGNSLKITVAAGQTNRDIEFPAWTAKNIANNHIGLIFENLTVASTGYGTLFLTVDAGYVNYYTRTFNADTYGLQNLSSANNGTLTQLTVAAGSPTFNGLTDGKLRLTAPAGEDLVIILHGLFAAQYCPPIVEIIHDDGGMAGYNELRPMLNKYGFKAGYSIIASLIGAGGYFTTDVLDDLYREGHDLLPHGVANLNTYGTVALALADIDTNTAYLEGRGYASARAAYVYPNGNETYSATDRVSIMNHLSSAGFTQAYKAGGNLSGTFGGASRWLIQRYAINATVNTTTLLNYLDLAIESGRGMVLMVHDIVASGAAGDQSNRADVQTIIDGIATRVRDGKCIVCTPSQAARLRRAMWAV